jgi:hypothetical protein
MMPRYTYIFLSLMSISSVATPFFLGGIGRADESTDNDLARAQAFVQAGALTSAIEVYSAILEQEPNNEALLGRSDAYLLRGDAADYAQALADRRATGAAGIDFTVVVDFAEIRVQKELKGTVKRGQQLVVSNVAGNFLYVISVDGKRDVQGYLKAIEVTPSIRLDMAKADGDSPARSSSVTDAEMSELELPLAEDPQELPDEEFENAIRRLTTALDQATDPETRQQTLLARGKTYLARGEKSDIDKALLDHIAAGEPGIEMTVLADSAQVRVVKDVKGTVKKGDRVLITVMTGEFLWVTTVNGDESIKGYITKEDVLPQVAQVATPVPQPTSTNSFAGTRSIPQSQSARPQFQSSQFSNSTGVRATSGAANDQFINRFIQKHGRPPSIWETPGWESPAEIRRLRAAGRIR